MTNELKSVNFGMNKFCVPSVMSALTGRSTDECAAVISGINGKKEIKAVDVPDIIKAFKKLRFDVAECTMPSRTLYGNLSLLSNKDGLYLFLVPKHIVAIRIDAGQIQIVDNASREPLDAKQSARLTQQVDKILKITPKPQPQFIDSFINVKCSSTYNRIDISKTNHYVNSEDDTIENKGHFYYSDQNELNQIIEALKCQLMNQ